jgi:isocitrate lyase
VSPDSLCLYPRDPADIIIRRDYPYTTVPNQVHRIFRAQQLHDRKHYDERMTASPEARAEMERIEYMQPIIADADTAGSPP